MSPEQLTLFDEPQPARRRPHIFQESEQRTTHPLQQRLQQPLPQPDPVATRTPKPKKPAPPRLPRPRSLNEYLANGRQYARQASSPGRQTLHSLVQSCIGIFTIGMFLVLVAGVAATITELLDGHNWTDISGWLMLAVSPGLYWMLFAKRAKWKVFTVGMMLVVGCGWFAIHQINISDRQHDTAAKQVVQEMARQQRAFFIQHGQWATSVSQLPKPANVNQETWQDAQLSLQNVIVLNQPTKSCVKITASYQLPVGKGSHNKQLCAPVA